MLCSKSPEGFKGIGKSFKKLNLRAHSINLLAIERDQEMIPNPLPAMKIKYNDKLICFGKLDEIKAVLGVKQ